MPTAVTRKNSSNINLHKKVPARLQKLVGKKQVWMSLGTADPTDAAIECAIANAKLETEWARLAMTATTAGTPRPPQLPEPSDSAPTVPRLSHQDLYALRRAAHVRIRDAHIANPPSAGFRVVHMLAQDLDASIRDFFAEQGVEASEANLALFRQHYEQARRDALDDLKRARLEGDFSPNPVLAKLPERITPKLDVLQAFEEYAAKGGLKGGTKGPTAKRWRPKIKAFVEWLGHRDLSRMTTENAYAWSDHLIDEGYARKSIRDVWIASLSATAGFMLERRRLTQNPFRGVKVRDDVAEKAKQELIVQPRQKGFTASEAATILAATAATPSHLISVEMQAARRWLPWLCAYSGARVNELTSLYPRDITRDSASKVWCMVIKPSLEKTSQWRTVPIHSHVIEQGFLRYVEERRKAGLPLFYDPARGRGGTAGNPQFKKVGERVGEWVRGLGIPIGVQPNHAWRHTFKSVARHVGMDREVEGFITGHRPKNANAGHDYGDRWVATMAAEIEKYPRYKIAALKKAPAPHKRQRRTPAQLAAAAEAKTIRQASRAKRAEQTK